MYLQCRVRRRLGFHAELVFVSMMNFAAMITTNAGMALMKQKPFV